LGIILIAVLVILFGQSSQQKIQTKHDNNRRKIKRIKVDCLYGKKKHFQQLTEKRITIIELEFLLPLSQYLQQPFCFMC
jgi:hypothetical protein